MDPTRKTPGPAAEFEEVVRRHAPWLVRWLERRLPAGVDAEDLAQEVFVVAWQKRGRLRDGRPARPWLIGVARKLAANAARKHGRRARLLRDAPFERLRERNAPEVDDLEPAIRALPEELSEVLDVYYSREVTYERAAEILGIPRATVQSRLRRAIAALRERLGKTREEKG